VCVPCADRDTSRIINSVPITRVNHLKHKFYLTDTEEISSKLTVNLQRVLTTKTSLLKTDLRHSKRCCWRSKSDAMLRRVVEWEVPDVCKDSTAFIIRVKQWTVWPWWWRQYGPSKHRWILAQGHSIVSRKASTSNRSRLFFILFYLFIYLLTFSMVHYIAILHALELNIHNTVTYIYQLCTISSTGWFCR